MTSGHVFKGSIKAVMSGVPSYDRSGEALIMNDQEIFLIRNCTVTRHDQ